MLKLWGRLSSVNVQKVVWCCDELGLAFERIDAGGTFGIVQTPEYLAKNPNGLVPVLEDGDFVLSESNAIVRYLAALHGEGTLWPREPRERARVDQWMEWQATGYTPAMLPAFMNLVRLPPEKRNPALAEESREKAEKLSAILDRHLADREFIAGSRFSPADIVVGCAAHRWFGLPLARESRPALERWYAGLTKRPGARQVLSLPVT